MSKRKPAMPSKHAHRPRTAAKAQRASPAIVRSAKDGIPYAAAATEPPLEHHNDPEEVAPLAEHPDLHVENAETALQDAKAMTDINPTKGIDLPTKGIDLLSSANASAWAYQAKLLEVAQANMQFAFEFVQRLVAIRSPLEFPSVIAELTSKRIALFGKHSTEIAAFSTKGRTPNDR